MAPNDAKFTLVVLMYFTYNIQPIHNQVHAQKQPYTNIVDFLARNVDIFDGSISNQTDFIAPSSRWGVANDNDVDN